MSLIESNIRDNLADNPQERVYHGPYLPLSTRSQFEDLWEYLEVGKEYDVTDFSLQCIRQLVMHRSAINYAWHKGDITTNETNALLNENDEAQGEILSSDVRRDAV